MTSQDFYNARGQRRVVITGMGAISPAGVGVTALWEKLMAAQCCISSLPEEDIEKFHIAAVGKIPNYDPIALGFEKKELRRFAPFCQYAIVAADEAMAQANMNLEDEDLSRFACIFGSGIGGIGIIERDTLVMAERGPRKVSPLFVPTIISNMAAGNLAIRYGLRGECASIVTACATGTQCAGEAYRLIKHGYADMALAGGCEEGTDPLAVAGFGNLGALSKERDVLKASRPFDVNRSGFVSGEGAGALVLESLEHAVSRKAHIIAEIVGYGATGDGYHMTAPEPHGEGATRAMQQALDEAGMSVADLGHLNAHGTATAANDKMEAAALGALVKNYNEQIRLGNKAGETVDIKDIPVTSVKGCIGHTLGAAGALEAIVCALSVQQSVVPPTIGFSEADPECPVCVSSKALHKLPQKVALSNSLGFGGHNGSLAIAPYYE